MHIPKLSINRRSFLVSTLAVTALATAPRALLANISPAHPLPVHHASSLQFAPVRHGVDRKSHVAADYREQVVIRWGDAVSANAPPFDPKKQSAAAQKQQFGFNNDFTAFFPLPYGSQNSNHGLLCVNHEYVDAALMHPKVTGSKEQAEIEMAAVGVSIVEILKHNDAWQVVKNSRFNRRIHALHDTIHLSGAAAGHSRLQTDADPSGEIVSGTLGNCAGGVTPWGTYLTCEENIDVFFSGITEAEAENYQRMGINGKGRYPHWGKHDARFNLGTTPHEPNRYGWVMEVDPYTPDKPPVKRTSLGRFKHEGACVTLTRDGRVVVYSGDDERYEYLYKFVSRNRYDAGNRDANRNLLDTGTLYVAQFTPDAVIWLPLVHGEGVLHSSNGFHSQADVCIETRRAATLAGATPMDRPEGIAVNPNTGHVYVALTNNSERAHHEIDAANPRARNKHGHILELVIDEQNHHATYHPWKIFLLAGNPQASDHAQYNQCAAPANWLSCPDNVICDKAGRLWITTDGMEKTTGMADGLYGCDTEGDGRGLTRQLYRAPRGAEMTGPTFTADNTTLFAAVQHPAEGSNYRKPSTRWPDFDPDLPPRSAVVAISHQQGAPIGEAG